MRTTHLVLLVAMLLAEVTPQNNQIMHCEEGWQFDYEHQKCYIYGTFKVNWFNAVSICKQYGGKLLEIKSAGERSITMFGMRYYDTGRAWTGGNNIFPGNQWRWYSNNELIGPYAPWFGSNPSNTNGNEYCMEIRPDAGYMWNDIDCEVKNAFICEKSPTYE